MTSTLVYESTRELPAETKQELDRLLAPIGVEAMGVRGDSLVLNLVNPSAAPRPFREALVRILKSDEARPLMADFPGVPVYS